MSILPTTFLWNLNNIKEFFNAIMPSIHIDSSIFTQEILEFYT